MEVVGDFYHKIHNLPEELDWREKGFKTPVYNQRDCGSCYAFSIANVLQAQIFKQTEKLLPLRYLFLYIGTTLLQTALKNHIKILVIIF